MKLTQKGRFWIWDEESREVDLAILDLQRFYKDKGLSIWGSSQCECCGACCYKFGILPLGKSQYKKCEFLHCSDEAECDVHGRNKPHCCKIYGCWSRNFKMGTDAERLQLIRIAIDILHTKKEKDLLELIGR